MLVCTFQRARSGRERRAPRIVHQVQLQARSRHAVAHLVQHLKPPNAPRKHAATPLRVDVLLRVARQRRDHADLVLGQKLRQALLPGLDKHGQIASVDHLDAPRRRLLHQVRKLGTQLGRTARQVERLDRARRLEQLHAPRGHLVAHHLRTLRRTLHVAVPARLIAVQPDVELQDLCRRPAQRGHASLRARLRERRDAEPIERLLAELVLFFRQGELSPLHHVRVEAQELLVLGHVEQRLWDEGALELLGAGVRPHVRAATRMRG